MPPLPDNPDSVEVEKEDFNVNEIKTTETVGQGSDHPTSIPVRLSKFIARHPLKCLLGALLVATVISYISIVVGKFKIEVDNKGWRSRGTLIANREMQNDLLVRVKDNLFNDEDGSVWEVVENEVIYGYVLLDDRVEDEVSAATCSVSDFFQSILSKNNLFAIYEAQNSKSILDSDVLFSICEAETITHDLLVENKACGCGDDTACPPPHSLVWILRNQYGKSDLSCSELKNFYTEDIQEEFTDMLVQCTSDILEAYDPSSKTYGTQDSCPPEFAVTMVDKYFGVDGNRDLKYSTSYYFTYKVDIEALYELRPKYATTDKSVTYTVYDTLRESQNELFVDSVLLSDMMLAVGSMAITVLAMMLHTNSLWLTFIGICQIVYSVPLAYFVYYFIAGLRFFPFLNFIGIFVAAALGADDIFVSVDKWKNARIDNQSGSTEDIAAVALPSSATAMLLTTSTTAVAFFATTICPVTPILCFALYCGLLIVFNYAMNIILIFPALCLYDGWLMKASRNPLVNFGCCSKSIFESRVTDEEGEKKESLIHTILGVFYRVIHKFRYIILAACLVATGICIYVALTIKLPDSIDVRLLPESSDYEKHFEWKKEILTFPLFYSGASNGEITWGILPADNGVRNNPDSLSTIVLDKSFNPSSREAQTYLLNFCEDLYESKIAIPRGSNYECPMNEFDSWLRNQTESLNPNEAFTTSCNGATSVPMEEDQFDSCIIAWSKLTNNQNVLQKGGKVTILRAMVQNSVAWDAPFTQMDKFWKRSEEYMERERGVAPEGVNKMFHTSFSFWWYDTNVAMLQTAIGAAAIAISFSAIIVFISSRSLMLSLFAVICITYVLAATTSSLVGFGWDLGFLESICFAILIGISCDFVIHFGHAYNHLDGDTSRFERTKFAMIHMGPSILAAAFTTFASAAVMLFCQVTFFTKFALILFMTILHATVGSFIFYLVLTECFGPSQPTKLVDSLLKKCFGRKKTKQKATTMEVGKGQKTEEVFDLS